MCVCIPASKAKIETSNTSAMVVHNDELKKLPMSIYSIRVSKSMTKRLPSRDETKTGHRLQAAENTGLSLETPTDCGMLYLCCQYDPGVACMQRSREGYLDSPTMIMRIVYEGFIDQTYLGMMRTHGHGLYDLTLGLGVGSSEYSNSTKNGPLCTR